MKMLTKTRKAILATGKPGDGGLPLTEGMIRKGWRKDEFGLIPPPAVSARISEIVDKAVCDAFRDARRIRSEEVM